MTPTHLPPVTTRAKPDAKLLGALPTGRETVPIDRARRHLAAGLPGGTTCPVCGQHAELYRRRISPAMIRDLASAYAAAGTASFHAPTVGIRGGDFAKLAHWGLIAELPARRGDGGRAGWWEITADGIAFLEGRGRVPERVLIYDGARVGYDGASITINAIAGGADFKIDDVRAANDDGVRDDAPPVTPTAPEAPGTPPAHPGAGD